MRYMGQNPSDAEVNDMLQKYGTGRPYPLWVFFLHSWRQLRSSNGKKKKKKKLNSLQTERNGDAAERVSKDDGRQNARCSDF